MQVSKVLVVDGNRVTRDALVTCLQFIGVEAHGAECAVTANCWLSTGNADVLVLSDELGEGGLMELVERCGPRESAPKIPILMLARDGIGVRMPPNYIADETLRRPVAVSRVVERIESLIDRGRCASRVHLTFGVLTLDLASGRATVDEASLALGRTEARLLAFFMGAPDRVFSRAQLLQRLWPANVRVEERTVDVHIRRLRAGLTDLQCADYIQTVRGSGYRFSRQLD